MKFWIIKIFTTWVYITLLRTTNPSSQGIVETPRRYTENLDLILINLVCNMMIKLHDEKFIYRSL